MKNMYCSVFGHQFVISKKVTQHVNEYKCKHCRAQMTINGKGELTPLTSKHREINTLLENIHRKRAKKKQSIQITVDY